MKINYCYRNGIDRSAKKTGGPTRYTNPCKRIRVKHARDTGTEENCKKTLHLTVINMISESHKKNWEKE